MYEKFKEDIVNKDLEDSFNDRFLLKLGYLNAIDVMLNNTYEIIGDGDSIHGMGRMNSYLQKQRKLIENYD